MTSITPGARQVAKKSGRTARDIEDEVARIVLADELRLFSGTDVLAAMKRGSVLVNISRGGIVDEAALVKELREGPLRGAVMDVFATEPLPKESELWALPNLVLTPQTGDIQGWQRKVTELFCDNLERWLSGASLRNLADPERGY